MLASWWRGIAEWGIGARISLGFAAVVGLLALVAGGGALSFQEIETGFADYRRVGDVGFRAQVIERDAVELRRLVQGFITTGEVAAGERVAAVRARLDGNLARMAADTPSDELRDEVARMRDVLAAYAQRFAAVVEARNRRSDLAREMNQVGDAARRSLTLIAGGAMAERAMADAAYAGAAQESLLLARLNAQQYLETGDRAYHDAARDRIMAFIDTAEAMSMQFDHPERMTLAEEAAASATRFDQAFTGLAEATAAYHALVTGDMAKLQGQFAALSEAVQAGHLGLMEEIAEDVSGRTTLAERANLLTALGAVALAAALTFFIARSIARPVRSMTDAMVRLAQGDSAFEVPALDRHDEIGAMAKALQVFKDNALAMEHMRVEQEAARRRGAEERRQARLRIAEDFTTGVMTVVERIAEGSHALRHTAEAMTAATGQAAARSDAAAAAAEDTSRNVQTVAAAADELACSIREIAEQVSRSTRMSDDAVAEVREADTIIKGLSESASRIGEVVTLIGDVASQTNLLALNATIEAARAGEAGKGFAVVANEVKSLANQTARATEEIRQQIAAIQQSTGAAVAAIESVCGTNGRISEAAAAIAAAVEEQGAATNEIARNVTQAAGGTRTVSDNVGDVSAAAAATGAAAAEVLTAVAGLTEQSAELRQQVAAFLALVRG